MCLTNREAGIACALITGTRKGPTYQIGAKVSDDDRNAEWNAVVVDGEWRPLDIAWACLPAMTDKSFTVVNTKLQKNEEERKRKEDTEQNEENNNQIDKDPNEEEDEEDEKVEEDDHGGRDPNVTEYFFLTDPEKLIYSHFPDEEEWQLIKGTVDWDRFRTMPNLKSHYFVYEMTPADDTPDQYILETVDGEVGIYHNVPEEYYQDLKLTYKLTSHRRRGKGGPNLDQYVFFQRMPGKIALKLSFPTVGRFKLGVFGGLKDSTMFNMMFAYVIDCNKAKEKCQPLPDAPEIGWGVGQDAEEVGLLPKSHTEGYIETEDGIVTIVLELKAQLSITHTIHHNEIDDEVIKKHAILRVEEDEVIIDMRLPKKGEYALKIFAAQEGQEGELYNVCNYLIMCLNRNKPQPFPALHDGKVGKSQVSDEIGVEAISHKTDIIDTQDGTEDIVFSCPGDTELFYEVHHPNKDRKTLLDEVSKVQDSQQITFMVRLKETGEYAFNIYAKNDKQTQMYHIHTYLIRYTNDSIEETPQTNRKSQEVKSEFIHTEEEEVKLKMKKPRGTLTGEFRKNNAQTSTKSKTHIRSMSKGNDVFFKLPLPSIGEYTFDVYENLDSLHSGAVVHIYTYTIIRHEKEIVEEVPVPVRQ